MIVEVQWNYSVSDYVASSNSKVSLLDHSTLKMSLCVFKELKKIYSLKFTLHPVSKLLPQKDILWGFKEINPLTEWVQIDHIASLYSYVRFPSCISTGFVKKNLKFHNFCFYKDNYLKFSAFVYFFTKESLQSFNQKWNKPKDVN